MCQGCVYSGIISQWLFDVIETFCERYADDSPYYGFGHIVLDDCNIETHHIQWCLNEAERDGRSSDTDVEKFLQWMLSIPENSRIV
jgi:hypothetical protein